jgi:hypothetical protein
MPRYCFNFRDRGECKRTSCKFIHALPGDNKKKKPESIEDLLAEMTLEAKAPNDVEMTNPPASTAPSGSSSSSSSSSARRRPGSPAATAPTLGKKKKKKKKAHSDFLYL